MAFFLRGANEDRYLAKQDRSSAVYQYINKHTPPTSKILIIGELRTLYLDRENIREIYYRIYDKYHLKDIIEMANLFDPIIIDGDEGIVILNPTKEEFKHYLKKYQTFKYHEKELLKIKES